LDGQRGGGGGSVRVSAAHEADVLRVDVDEQGPGFDAPPDGQGQSLGMLVMEALADDLELDSGPGAHVRARFELLGPAGPHGRRIRKRVRAHVASDSFATAAH
jgi:hypothetical protein